MVQKKTPKKGSFDVICVGSATVDCFVNLPVNLKNIKQGSKLLIDDIHLLTGGGGTNVAVGLSRLGLKTGFIGEVGDDLSASIIKQDLEKEGVDFLVKQHSRHKTAYSVVLEAKGKDRSILVYKGASSFLHSQEIPKNIKTDWFYFASVMGSSFKTMEHVAGFAKRNKINIYFNPSSYMIKQGLKVLKRVISATKIISMNKEEAQILLKSKSKNVKTLLKGLNKLGPDICIITDGKKGAYAYFDNKFYSGKTHKITPIDTTGAGDAFGTGFLAGILIKKDLPTAKRINFAMKLGIANSESVIRQVGAKPGLLTRAKARKIR
jgi:ribokinase